MFDLFDASPDLITARQPRARSWRRSKRCPTTRSRASTPRRQAYAALVRSRPPTSMARLLADAWCAAFVIRKETSCRPPAQGHDHRDDLPRAREQPATWSRRDVKDEIAQARRASTSSSTGTWRSRTCSSPASRRHRRRGHPGLARRLRRRARQPAVGADQAPGAGVVRRAASRDRQGPERRRPPQDDRSSSPRTTRPSTGRSWTTADAAEGREPLRPRLRPLPALRPGRRQHLHALRRAEPPAHRADGPGRAASSRPASPPTTPPSSSSRT